MLQKCSIWRVAQEFFKQPTKAFGVAEISRAIRLAPTSVRNHLEELETTHLIRREQQKQGQRTYPVFFANRNHETFKRYKLLANIDSLHDMTKQLVTRSGARTVVVFGSYRYGEDDETSDIDLFIEGATTSIDTRLFEQHLKRRIQLHTTEFRKLSGTMRQSVINGITLYGSIEL